MALPRFVSSYLTFFSFGQGASFEWEDGGDSVAVAKPQLSRRF